MVLGMLRLFGKIDQIWALLSRRHRWAPGVQNPSKVRSRAQVCWSTAITKSSFTKIQLFFVDAVDSCFLRLHGVESCFVGRRPRVSRCRVWTPKFVPTPKEDPTAELAPSSRMNLNTYLTEWNFLPFTRQLPFLADYNDIKKYNTPDHLTPKQLTALKFLMKKRYKHRFLPAKATPSPYLATNTTLTMVWSSSLSSTTFAPN